MRLGSKKIRYPKRTPGKFGAKDESVRNPTVDGQNPGFLMVQELLHFEPRGSPRRRRVEALLRALAHVVAPAAAGLARGRGAVPEVGGL